MRQEHRFCAEVYHRLHTHIEHRCPVYLCLDGQAAKKGVREGLLKEEVVPDFIFYFIRGMPLFLMEAKMVQDNKVNFFGKTQPNAWARQANALYKPVLWIGADEALKQFFMWHHRDFELLLERGTNARGNIRIPLPETVKLIPSLDNLVEEVLQFARKNGYYPEMEKHD